MQIVSKLTKIRIGDDVWQSGDNILLSAITVHLDENDRGSTCSFSVNDLGLLIGAKYREMSVQQGSILVPSDLLGKDGATATAITGTATAAPGASGPLSANADATNKAHH